MHKKHFFLSNNIAEAVVSHHRNRALTVIPFLQKTELHKQVW